MNDEREPRADEGVRILGADTGTGRRRSANPTVRPPAAAPAPAGDVVWADDEEWGEALSSPDLRQEGSRQEGSRQDGLRQDGSRQDGSRQEGLRGTRTSPAPSPSGFDDLGVRLIPASSRPAAEPVGHDPGDVLSDDWMETNTAELRGDLAPPNLPLGLGDRPAMRPSPGRVPASGAAFGTPASRTARAGGGEAFSPRAPIRIETSSFDDAGNDDSGDVAEPQPVAGRRRSRAVGEGSERSFDTLGPRLATGLGLILAAVGAALVDDRGRGLLILVAGVVAFASVEFLQVFRTKNLEPAIPVAAVGVIALVLAAYWRGPWGQTLVMALAILTTILWFLANAHRGRSTSSMAVTLLALAYLGFLPSFGGLLLRGSPLDPTHGVEMLLFPILCTVAHDTVGYFIGRSFGHTKLAPSISPNKTVEGLIGGLIAVLAATWFLTEFLDGPWTGASLAVRLSLAIPTLVMAPLGDLCESLIKRDLGVKDMGSLLPGHGGMFDRFDGMMFTIPAFAFAMHAHHWLRIF